MKTPNLATLALTTALTVLPNLESNAQIRGMSDQEMQETQQLLQGAGRNTHNRAMRTLEQPKPRIQQEKPRGMESNEVMEILRYTKEKAHYSKEQGKYFLELEQASNREEAKKAFADFIQAFFISGWHEVIQKTSEMQTISYAHGTHAGVPNRKDVAQVQIQGNDVKISCIHPNCINFVVTGNIENLNKIALKPFKY